MSLRLARLAAIAVGILAAAPGMAQPPTMAELWPNEDGRSWIYSQHYQDLQTPEDVQNHTRIFFDGTIAIPTATDLLPQYLRQVAIGASPGITSGAVLADPLLRQLWVARPDLRTTIRNAVANGSCPVTRAPDTYSLLLGGELPYRKTADEIAAWRCGVIDTRAWLWLVSDLTIGHEFTLQLVPDIANDVFLHGTIAAIEPVTVGAGTFADCVRVDYVVDYGLSECVDTGGTPTGTSRSETRGHVHYAPGIGPVESSEDFIPFAELTGTCGPEGVGEVSVSVTRKVDNVPQPPRRSGWGGLQ